MLHKLQCKLLCQETYKRFCMFAESICQALEASLADSSTAANTAESASQQRQTAVIQLVQQSVSVLGLDPEQLFPGVLQRLKDTFRGDYEQKLKIADKKAIMAQVILCHHMWAVISCCLLVCLCHYCMHKPSHFAVWQCALLKYGNLAFPQLANNLQRLSTAFN